jgi:succinate dehydrogenase / fumarate reductase flavoprotein subunit
VILATGGAGRLYTGTTNAYACTGDGMALALRVGEP